MSYFSTFQSTLVAPPLIPSGMNSGTELEFLRVEVKDLSEKLETLRYCRVYLSLSFIDWMVCLFVS